MSDQLTSIELRIFFFAKAKDIAGLSNGKVILNNNFKLTGNDLLEIIIQHYPKLEILKNSIILSLNEKYIEMEQTIDLKNNDEVAIIPPLSGG